MIVTSVFVNKNVDVAFVVMYACVRKRVCMFLFFEFAAYTVFRLST